MNQTSVKLPTNQKIAVIQSTWHKDIVEQASKTFIKKMNDAGVPENKIDVFDVSGVLEIPLQAKKLAETGEYAIIECCGLVVNGGMYRHDFVGATVIDGMMRVQLDTGVPVLSSVLTPHNFHEHEHHEKFFFDHFVIKGEEAAHACIKTLENMSRFNVLSEAA